MKKFSETAGGAIFLAFLACIMWSGNFVYARGAADWLLPIGFAFWRWAIAFLIMLFFARKHIKSGVVIMMRNPTLYIVMGFISVGIYNTLVYKAGHFTSANSIALLAATSPIWTMILAGILKIDKLNRFKIAGVGIACMGALYVILKGDINNILHLQFNLGDGMMFVASWLWSFYSIMLKKKPKEMHPSFFLLAIIFYGLMILTPMYVIELIYVGHTPVTPKVITAYLYVAICASVMAWYFFNNAVHVIGPVRTSIIYYSMPVLTGLISVYTIGEHLKHYHIVAFILVFAGICVSNIRTKPKAKQKKEELIT